MNRRKRGRNISGIVLLDKPAGVSSNHALQSVRRLFNARKAGHTGSLDPFATGMLPLCLGEASKTAAFMIDSDKTYRATARLGVATDSGDVDGEVIKEMPVPGLLKEKVEAVFAEFTGELEQVPPMYSALKHQGQPLYKLARQGKVVERKARTVHIHQLKLLELGDSTIIFEVSCSKGTYIRTLAEDLAKALSTCAHLVSLRRLFVNPFEPGAMVTLEQLKADAADGTLENHLLAVDAGLPDWPVMSLDAVEAARFQHGNPQPCPGSVAGRVRVYGPDEQVLGLGECNTDGMLKPRRVFNIGLE